MSRPNNEEQTNLEIEKATNQYRGEKISNIICKSLGCVIGLEIASVVNWERMLLFGIPTEFDISLLLSKLSSDNHKIFIYVNDDDPVSNVAYLKKLKREYDTLIELSIFSNKLGHSYDNIVSHFEKPNS